MFDSNNVNNDKVNENYAVVSEACANSRVLSDWAQARNTTALANHALELEATKNAGFIQRLSRYINSPLIAPRLEVVPPVIALPPYPKHLLRSFSNNGVNDIIDRLYLVPGGKFGMDAKQD